MNIPDGLQKILEKTFVGHSCLSDLTPDTSLNDLDADDIHRVEIAMEIEDAFEEQHAVVSDEKAARWETIADIIEVWQQLDGVKA